MRHMANSEKVNSYICIFRIGLRRDKDHSRNVGLQLSQSLRKIFLHSVFQELLLKIVFLHLTSVINASQC